MKALVSYRNPFSITKTLPHADVGDDSNSDILGDDVTFIEGKLILSSRCGTTTFEYWEDMGDHYVVSGTASYDGAWHALNAIWGIEFAECEITKIESSIGAFDTKEDYEFARRTTLVIKWYVEHFSHARHDTHKPQKVQQAEAWLENFEEALGDVIDLNDPCRCPVHHDGHRGYIN